MSAAVASSLKVNEVQQQTQPQETAGLCGNSPSDVARASEPAATAEKNNNEGATAMDANNCLKSTSQEKSDSKNENGGGTDHNHGGHEEKTGDTAGGKPKDGSYTTEQGLSTPTEKSAVAASDRKEPDGQQQNDKPVESSNPNRLPPSLHRILTEVATTGESSTLSWNSTRKGSSPSQEVGATAPTKKRGLSTGSSSSAALARSSFLSSSTSGGNAKAKVAGAASQPPRKRHRNGLHSSSHRKPAARAGHSNRKRPHHMIRASGGGGSGTTTATATATTTTTTTTATVAAAASTSPGIPGVAAAAATGRLAASTTSGSEPEDTSQYDSEGTSFSSTSELSVDQQQHWQMRPRSQHLNLRVMNNPSSSSLGIASRAGGSAAPPLYTTSLREAFRMAVGLVLEDWFQHKGGYKLSPAESKIHEGRSLSAKDIFTMRKERLLRRLEASLSSSSDEELGDGGPFTIQRIAEVLVAPEKYYTQTHKLCNCLEKLLLVSSPITAFGGSRGGVTSQSRIEEQELAALADERDRIQSELRQARRRRSSLASTSSAPSEAALGSHEAVSELALTTAISVNEAAQSIPAGEKKDDTEKGAVADSEVEKDADPDDVERREQLEAAARASLRSKFDHVGIDPHHHHHGAVVNANVKTIAESRSLTNSPPPPSLNAPNLSGGVLRSPHATHGEHPTSPVRPPSPILFNDVAAAASPPTPPNGAAAVPNPNPNMHLLQMHHAAAVAGVSPFDLMSLGTSAAEAVGNTAAATGGTLLGTAQLNGMRELDVDCRSSASSDVDSESDDVSFDDSASDRSDGSDSGFVGTSASTAEGAAASTRSAVARAMALKRQQTRTTQQQQQQRSQKVVAAAEAGNTAPPDLTSTAGAASAQEEGDVSDSSGDMAD